MKKKFLNKLKKLAKKKYIFLSYYQNEKECVKRYNQNQLRVKLVKWLFSLHLSSIEFLFEQPISNIYGIKFSDNEEESFESIDNWHNNIYTDYINYDAIDDKKGCINQIIKGNKVVFRKDITCNYETKSYNIEEFLNLDNKIIKLVKASDFKVETVNYDKIETIKDYFSFNLYGKEFLIKQKKIRNLEKIMKFAPRNMKPVKPLTVVQDLKELIKYYDKVNQRKNYDFKKCFKKHIRK